MRKKMMGIGSKWMAVAAACGLTAGMLFTGCGSDGAGAAAQSAASSAAVSAASASQEEAEAASEAVSEASEAASAVSESASDKSAVSEAADTASVSEAAEQQDAEEAAKTPEVTETPTPEPTPEPNPALGDAGDAAAHMVTMKNETGSEIKEFAVRLSNGGSFTDNLIAEDAVFEADALRDVYFPIPEDAAGAEDAEETEASEDSAEAEGDAGAEAQLLYDVDIVLADGKEYTIREVPVSDMEAGSLMLEKGIAFVTYESLATGEAVSMQEAEQSRILEAKAKRQAAAAQAAAEAAARQAAAAPQAAAPQADQGCVGNDALVY